MFTVLVVFQILISISLVIIVMIQHGKGAEAGAALTSGSQSLLGTATGGSTMTRITAILAVLFIVNSLSMAYLSPRNQGVGGSGSVIFDSSPVDSPDRPGEDVPDIPLPQ